MKNEIENLIEKYEFKIKSGHGREVSTFYSSNNEVVKDLQSLLELYQSRSEIKKVYERFKHLDMLLSDFVWMNDNDNKVYATCHALWMAIKATQEEKQRKGD